MAAEHDPTSHPHVNLMTQMYAAGQSLAVIGAHFDLPQERIRDALLAEHGSLDALRPAPPADTQITAPAYTAELLREAQAAIDECGELIEALCAAGHSSEETIFRVRALFPAHSASALRLAINTSKLHFAEPRTAVFTKDGLIAGMLLAFATKNGLASDPGTAAQQLPFPLLAETLSILDSAGAEAKTRVLVLTRIQQARAQLAEHPESTLGGTEYDKVREELVKEFNLVIARGTTAWPPTRQTVSDRFGGWNEAVSAAGFRTSKLGRARGLLKFSEADYRAVIAAYLADMGRHGQNPSFASFTAWSKEQKTAGKKYPSPAAVRDFFGGWSAALRSAEQPSGDGAGVWNLPTLG